jgi:hypothetical protein
MVTADYYVIIYSYSAYWPEQIFTCDVTHCYRKLLALT